MYDGMPQPGRNDLCWCGSGKKYKKCHLETDERLQALFEAGEEVPARSLLKTPEDIEGVRRSAEVNIGVLDYVTPLIAPDITTEQIDKWVYLYTTEHGAIPAPLHYEGFPKSVCTSVNNEVCHGIPSEHVVLHEGDIVNVDCSTIKDGYFSDSSRMFCVGEVSDEARELVEVTKQAMEAGFKAVVPWGHLGDVAAAVQEVTKAHGFSVVREYGGHGIGHEFHEDPFVSFVAQANTGIIMAPGLMFTIEPMVNKGGAAIDMTDPNGWTVRTADGSLSAQWEIQVVVTENGPLVLSW